MHKAILITGLLALMGLSSCRESQAAEPGAAQPSVAWIGNGGASAGGNAAAVAPRVAGEERALPVADSEQPASPRRSAALEKDLSQLVDAGFRKAAKLSKGKLTSAETLISISVRDAETGAIVADVRGARSMRPASNMKVVTTAAALALLGINGTFETRFELAGPVEDGVLRGDLIVRGGGDPVVRDGSGGRVEAFFDPLTAALAKAGIDRIAGDVVLDEGDFLVPGTGPSWPSANQHWKDYCAFAAGLTLNGGVLEAQVTARSAGSKASVQLHPIPTGIKQQIGVTTKAGSLNDVRVGATSKRVTVGGAIGAHTGLVDATFRHPDPVGLFGAVLEDRVTQAGISIDGGIVRRRGSPAGVPLLVISSQITDSLVPINTYSTNAVADQLFFKMGHDFGGGGTRAGGQTAVSLALDELGVSAQGLVQVDGSGLSRDNRVAPVQLSALLWGALRGFDRGRGAAQLFKDSLAVMGRSGTLEERMKNQAAAGHVFAKTGFIDGTSALSGLVVRPDGRALIFSILVNYPTIGGLNKGAWKPMQEDMVARLFAGEMP